MKSLSAAGFLAIFAAACVVLLSASGARPPIDTSSAALAEAGGTWLYLFLASLGGAFVFNNLVVGGGAVVLAVTALMYVR